MSPSEQFRSYMRPGDGERRALRGYGAQYRASASVIHKTLLNGTLQWVGLADRNAGGADDLVLGLPDRVIAHQFKHSDRPQSFRLRTVLIGADGTGGLLGSFVDAWSALHSEGHRRVEIHYITSHFPSHSSSDRIAHAANSHTLAFLREHQAEPARSLDCWRATRWGDFIDDLHARSGLDAGDFECFLGAFHVRWGVAYYENDESNPRVADELTLINSLLWQLVSDRGERERWTRHELLGELGWPDRSHVHHVHRFPVGNYVQRNAVTESTLRLAIENASSGYLSLLGSPGSGKSTLLQTAIESTPNLAVVRYLAFVLGTSQGLGRGEAALFFDDLASSLIATGLHSSTLRAETNTERQQKFAELLNRAGDRWKDENVRTLIVVDGLDHIPREELPRDTLLAALPLPHALPEGVLVLLGTQRLELEGMPPSVAEQAADHARQVEMAPLDVDAVHAIAERLALDPNLPRDRLYEVSRGHPLVTRYLIERLRGADPNEQKRLLDGEFVFEGNLESVYSAAWRELGNDAPAREVLAYIAHAEAPLTPTLLASALSDPDAIERALKIASHLLSRGRHGWEVFHNSFRLFIRRQGHTRYGELDPDYPSCLYRVLAELAERAPPNSPQRFLELRYCARAGEHAQVLALADPALFRQHVAEGRASEQVQADIRLAYERVAEHGDARTLFALMLAADEIARRAYTLTTTPELVSLSIALGDLDTAQNLVDEGAPSGYLLVDALLEAGESDRAKALFERLHAELTSDTDPLRSGDSDAIAWTKRAFHFRDIEQIKRTIAQLVERDAAHRQREEAAAEANDYHLSHCVAIAMVQDNPDIDTVATATKLGLEEPDITGLALLSAINSNTGCKTYLDAVQTLLTSPFFDQTPPAWRRQAAECAVNSGERDLANAVFANLEAPNCKLLADDQFCSDEDAEHVLCAVVEHSRLGALLGIKRPAAERPDASLLAALQTHGETLGKLRGRAERGDSVTAVSKGEVPRAARTMLRFLDGALRAKGDSFSTRRLIAKVSPVLATCAIETAALVSDADLQHIAALLEPPSDGTRAYFPSAFWRETAVAQHRTGADIDNCYRRLEKLLETTSSGTPAEHVEALAALAIAFAKIGDVAKAQVVFRRAMNETLGHAQAAKKDPQYDYWLQLLRRANTADPGNRGDRLAILLRMANGMSQTEGYSSNDRIATTLVTEAVAHSPATGLAAAHALIDLQALEWTGALDALLLGLIRRRPDLVPSATVTWCALVLPHYQEPYFQTERTGKYIEEAISLVNSDALDSVTSFIQSTVEALSRQSERLLLLSCLDRALKQRNKTSSRTLTEANTRWSVDVPPADNRSSSSTTDRVKSLTELDQALQEESESEDDTSSSAYHFRRLAQKVPFEEARAVFERWQSVNSDPLNCLAVVDLALAEGREEGARKILDTYPEHLDRARSWSRWEGSPRLHYLRQRVALDYPGAQAAANVELCSALGSAQTYSDGLLDEIETVFTTITSEPPWIDLWDLLEERLSHTREFQIGENFEYQMDDLVGEEALLAELYSWAFDVGSFELRYFARMSIPILATTNTETLVLERVIRCLLQGKEEKPAEALSLLLTLHPEHSILELLLPDIEPLVDHPDYAVAALAQRVCAREGRAVPITLKELPTLYRLAIQDIPPLHSVNSPSDATSKQLGVGEEDAAYWATCCEPLFGMLSNGPISAAHVLQRVRQLIDEWGGPSIFGSKAIDQRESNLRVLGLGITYLRPDMQAGLRALRHVATDFWRAGLIDERVMSRFLDAMGYSERSFSPMIPSVRPANVTRPNMDAGYWRDEERTDWLNAVEEDLPCVHPMEGAILAEWSRWELVQSNVNTKIERIRVPFPIPQPIIEPLAKRDERIPVVREIDGELLQPTDGPSPVLVRWLKHTPLTDIPDRQLVICPIWMSKLRWRVGTLERLVYLDNHGEVVARMSWWRDGCPTHREDEVRWGEGHYMTLTAEGSRQLARFWPAVFLATIARRSHKAHREKANAESCLESSVTHTLELGP